MPVLLAEDDEVLARATARSLTAEGFTVDRAETAADALHLWRGGLYDLAMLDAWLPDGDARLMQRPRTTRDSPRSRCGT